MPLSKAETQQLLERREWNLIRRCVACNTTVSTVESFLRWHLMDFCSVKCLNEMLKCNHADHYGCWECDAQIKISNLLVHTEYIEAELRSFCSEKCLIKCMDAILLCKYCQKTISSDDITTDKNDMIFCSNQCEENYKRIVIGSTESTPNDDTFCTDCQQRGPAALNLLCKGQLYPFCSFACFSYIQKSSGIHAGKNKISISTST